MTLDLEQRPTSGGPYNSLATTPNAAAMILLLGPGIVQGGTALSRDEYEAVRKLYGFVPDANPLLQAGADRNMMVRATHDGLRLLAWIARFVPPGEDPLRHLVQAASDAGWDVCSDIEWAEEDPRPASAQVDQRENR